MKPAATISTYTVDFTPKPAPRPTVAPKGRVPRVARLLALGHRIDGMIRAGELRDLADAARACGVTRARMTQVTSLLLLVPEIQEAILDLPPVTQGRDSVTERSLRAIVAETAWTRQLDLWRTERAASRPRIRDVGVGVGVGVGGGDDDGVVAGV